MKWNTAAQKLGNWLRPVSPAAVGQAEALTIQVEMPAQESAQRGEPTVRKLRRRLLSRKGTHLLASMVNRQDKGMLSILDVNGMVVFWHDGSQAVGHGKDVIDNHVAQFYAPAKNARALAMGHMNQAFTQGGSTEYGWRRRVDGTVFWGSTLIEPLLLADGKLQGFTHLTRAVNEPREPVVRIQQDATGLWEDAPRSRTLSFVAHTLTMPGIKLAQSTHRHYNRPQLAFG